MAQPTRRQLLRELVSEGRLTDEQARRIESAPRWAASRRETGSFLGVALVVTGVVLTAAPLLSDASRVAVAAALIAAAAVTGGVRRRVARGGRLWWVEILECVVGGLLAWSGGILLDVLLRDGALAGLIVAVVAGAVGAFRHHRTRFAGAVTVTAAASVALAASADVFRPGHATMSALVWVAAAALLLLPRRVHPARELQQGAAALLAGGTAVAWSVHYEHPVLQLPAAAAVAALLLVGGRRSSVVLLLSGCVAGVYITVQQVSRYVEGAAVGVITSVIGIAAVLLLLMRRREVRGPRRSPGR